METLTALVCLIVCSDFLDTLCRPHCSHRAADTGWRLCRPLRQKQHKVRCLLFKTPNSPTQPTFHTKVSTMLHSAESRAGAVVASFHQHADFNVWL